MYSNFALYPYTRVYIYPDGLRGEEPNMPRDCHDREIIGKLYLRNKKILPHKVGLVCIDTTGCGVNMPESDISQLRVPGHYSYLSAASCSAAITRPARSLLHLS